MNGPLVFLAASGFACLSATFFVSIVQLRSAIDVALAWAVGASTVVVTTVLLAGAVLNHLAASLVLALNAALAAVLALIWLRLGRLPSHVRLSVAPLEAVLREIRADWWLLVLVVVAGAEMLWRLVIAYLMPPYAADALWYHLTTVAGWLQAGRIGPSPFTIWSTVYPYNAELLFTWPALLLGNDTFVDAVPLPFAIVGAFAVAGIGRTAGLSRRGAAVAGCLFLLTPIVLSQATANYTDLIFIAFVLTALHFLLRFIAGLRAHAHAGNRVHIFLAGLAGGLALGTKDLGIVYLVVLSLLLVVHLAVARVERRITGTHAAWSLLAFALPLLAFGSYHYLETWIRFGNPLYPVRVTAFGFEIFGGRPLEWFLTPPLTDGAWWQEIWGQWRRDYFFIAQPRFHAYSYDDRASGLGPLWSYLGIPLLAVFALRLLRTNRATLLNLLLPVAAIFALQPYRWWSRFTMIVVAVGVIAIVACVEALPRTWSSALKTLVLGLVAVGIAFPTVKIDGAFWASRILSVARIAPRERTIGRVAVPGYRWVDRTPPRATIGVDASSAFLGGAPAVFAYPLFGSGFEHHVYPLPHTSEAALAGAIMRKRISFISVGRGSAIDRWAERAAEAGCAHVIYDGPLYPDDPVRAYRIAPACAWLLR